MEGYGTAVLHEGPRIEDFGVGRRCEKCRGKVNRYNRPLGDARNALLLCSPCLERRVDRLTAERPKRDDEGSPGEKLPGLLAARKDAVISQSRLADLADLSRTALQKIENGGGARASTVSRLASALGTTPERLREGENV